MRAPLALLISVLCCTQLASLTRASELEAVSMDIVRISQENGIRGGAYALIEHGAIVALKTFGYVDLQKTALVTPDTLFRVGSISKTVTSLLALSMVEGGFITLDTQVSAVLPDAGIVNAWQDHAPLRLVHLLEHTGGLAGSSFYEYAQVGPDLSPADYLARMQGRLQLRWPPGRYYSYANGGHTIAARLLEVVSGRPFDELVRKRVFGPLGMRSATFSTRQPGLEALAASFANDGTPIHPWAMAVRPSGALAASVRDMARLALFLATDGASVESLPVSPHRLRRMRRGETALPARHGYEYAYGLGMFGFVVGQRVWWGHWGKTEGFLANLGVLPERQYGFVLLVNTSNRPAMTAMRTRLADYLSRDLPRPALPVISHTPPRPEFSGCYLPFTHDMRLRSWLFGLAGAIVVDTAAVDGKDAGLRVRPLLPFGEATTLSPLNDIFYRAEAYPVATHLFLPDQDRTVLFGPGQDTYRRLEPAEALTLKAGLVATASVVVLSLVAALSVLLVWRRGRASLVVPLCCFGLAGVMLSGLVGLFFFFGFAARLDRLLLLGVPGARSLMLLLLSVIWPLCALLGSLSLARVWSGLPPVVRAGGLLLAGVYLMVAGVMAWYGWLPLVTWRA